MNFNKAIIKNKITGDEIGCFESVVLKTNDNILCINEPSGVHIISFKDIVFKEVTEKTIVLNGVIFYRYKKYAENTPVKIVIE